MATPDQTRLLNALTAVMFKAAPGATNIAAFETALDNGASLVDIANDLAALPLFQGQFAATTDPVGVFLASHLGLSVGSAAFAEGRTYIADRLADGATVGTVMVEVTEYLMSDRVTAGFQEAAQRLSNRADVAETYNTTESSPASGLFGLQLVLDDVDATADSVTRATAEVAAGVADQSAGLATDGYIAGATIWADLNGNGALDAGEPQTTSDDQGNYDFGAAVGGPLLAQGGTDTATGLDVLGTLRTPGTGDVISPLTTLAVLLEDQLADGPLEAADLLK